MPHSTRSRRQLLMAVAPLIMLIASMSLVIRGIIVVVTSPDASIKWPVKEFVGGVLLIVAAGLLSLAYDRRFPSGRSQW